MTEQRLRELLQRAVPEAPDLDPVLIRRRALTRSRSKVWVAAASAAAVLVIAVGPVALNELNGDDRSPSMPPSGLATQPTPTPTPTASREASPYDAPTCPPHLPDAGAAVTTMTDLSGIVSVRLCPELNPNRDARWQPSAEDLARLENADALVLDVDGFLASVRALPPGLPDYCETQKGPYIRQALLFLRADGTRELLTAPGCELLSIAGRRVDVGAVWNLYEPALERQRDTLTYTRPFDDELTCTTSERGDNVRPGRERIVAAIACDFPPGAESIPDGLQPIQLDSTQLAGLDRAWSRPGASLVRGPNGEHKCLDVQEPASFVIAATDRSDVVRLNDTPCGFFVWNGSRNHFGATIPTSFSGLQID